MASMNQPLMSSTNVDTLIFPRHQSAIRDLTLNIAPNIRPPLLKFWVSSIDRSFVARSIIYSGTLGRMRIDSHSHFRIRSQIFKQPSNTEGRHGRSITPQAHWA